jgi:hypothetical protein
MVISIPLVKLAPLKREDKAIPPAPIYGTASLLLPMLFPLLAGSARKTKSSLPLGRRISKTGDEYALQAVPNPRSTQPDGMNL